MSAKIFRIKASFNSPIDLDWQKKLGRLLGHRPRRLSLWCELGLFGSLSCLNSIGQQQLPNSVAVRVFTEFSAITATKKAMEEENKSILMPFTFMQTQPNQLFNAIGGTLDWCGDGVIMSYEQYRFGEAGFLHSIKKSAMLGWVDEHPEFISRWIFLEKTDVNLDAEWKESKSVFQTSVNAQWLKVDENHRVFEAD